MAQLSLSYLRLRARGFNKRTALARRGWQFLGTADPVKATLTTALSGANNDLVYSSNWPGPLGNAIRVQYVVAGTNTPLSVSRDYDARLITVNVATDGGGSATSTASDVRAAVEADPKVADLVQASLAGGNDGTGVVTALAPTALSGGA